VKFDEFSKPPSANPATQISGRSSTNVGSPAANSRLPTRFNPSTIQPFNRRKLTGCAAAWNANRA
jgi:hypothetical protein